MSVAQAEVMLNQFGAEFAGESLQPGSMTSHGSTGQLDAPYGVYPCAGEDQWCVITVRGDSDWDTAVRGDRRARPGRRARAAHGGRPDGQPGRRSMTG